MRALSGCVSFSVPRCVVLDVGTSEAHGGAPSRHVAAKTALRRDQRLRPGDSTVKKHSRFFPDQTRGIAQRMSSKL